VDNNIIFNTLYKMKEKDKKKIKRKIRRDEAVELSKRINLKTIAFKNKKKYIRKRKHQDEN